MKLSQFAQMRGFQESHNFGNPNLVDHFLEGEGGDEIRENLKMKRIQFDTFESLTSELDRVCTLLDCSKRVFLEMAVFEALKAAEAQFHEAFEQAHGVDIAEAHEALQKLQKGA
jgi:hypothetical protein